MYYRKVIQVRAADSPNVRYALAEIAAGRAPSNRVLVEGVLTYAEYMARRTAWDKKRQTVGLDAEFYEGPEEKLYPFDWLARAARLHEALQGRPRKAEAVGIDPAEGGDRTAFVAVDRYGVIELLSKRTPDTNVICGESIAFGRKHNVPPAKWVFDRGGGGKQHADRLRAQGFPVRTVAFGEGVSSEPRNYRTPLSERREVKEERTVYKNRRAEMYWELRELIDPLGDPLASRAPTFAIPWYKPDWEPGRKNLNEQMRPIPLTYDDEGKLYILPKNKKNPDDSRKTLTEIIGHSPDELDALVLAVHGMLHKEIRGYAGVIG